MIAKTKEMIQISKDINGLAVEYQTLISKMFVDISNLSSNGSWSGDSADTFVNRVMEDKDGFVKVGDHIKEFGNLILDHANSIDRNLSQLLEDEANG